MRQRFGRYAFFAAVIGLAAAGQISASDTDYTYRADQASFRVPEASANPLLPRLLDAYRPPPIPSPATTASRPAPTSTRTPATPLLYVWDRVRAGSTLPRLEGPLVSHWQRWYLDRPQLLQALFERSRRYVFHVVEEIDKRGMPTELALLPMVESGYNPMALSSAQASGLWQFIPSTGRDYKLEQSPRYDARRDIIASTSAALDYLQSLFVQFGDWRLALAAYNSGEAAVTRAIERNKAKRLPTDYQSLNLPEETRNYLPKLQALKNIVAAPGALRIEIERAPNRAYFATIASGRDLDVNVAARLAEVPLDEFRALNPAHNLPTMSAGAGAHIVLPVEKLDTFVSNLENHRKALAREQTGARKQRHKRPAVYVVKAGDTLAKIASKHGLTESLLRTWNRIAESGIKVGQTLHVQQN